MQPADSVLPPVTWVYVRPARVPGNRSLWLEEMMVKRSLLVSVMALVAGAAAIVPATDSAAVSAAPGFHAAVLMPGSGGGTEPSLAIWRDGTRYVSWQSPGEFASSRDGVHFKNLGVPDPDAVGDVTNAVSYSGALYNGQICGGTTILHSCIYRSLDGGHTWETRNRSEE